NADTTMPSSGTPPPVGVFRARRSPGSSCPPQAIHRLSICTPLRGRTAAPVVALRLHDARLQPGLLPVFRLADDVDVALGLVARQRPTAWPFSWLSAGGARVSTRVPPTPRRTPTAPGRTARPGRTPGRGRGSARPAAGPNLPVAGARRRGDARV